MLPKRWGKASGKLSGIGFIMEGIGWNPVVDEFQSDMIWRDQTPEVEEWIKEFVRRRYGADVPEAQAAWKTLYRTAYQRPGIGLWLKAGIGTPPRLIKGYEPGKPHGLAKPKAFPCRPTAAAR